MRIGIWLQPNTNPRAVVDQICRAERLGFDFVGLTDGQMIWRDVYVCLAAAAVRTERVRLGTWVTNAVTRHPTVTANTGCTLNELSEGRAFIGIGSGDDSVITINRERSTLKELAGVVELMQRLARGEEVDAGAGERTWTLSTGGGAWRLPIYWAGAGPRSLEYAGRHADGVIHSGWFVPELMEQDLAAIRRGIASRAAPGPFDTVFNTAVSIHDDEALAYEWARPYAARAFIDNSSPRVPGWSEEDRVALRKQYEYYDHFSPRNRAVQSVPESLISKKVAVGRPADVTRQLQVVADAGYTHAGFFPVGDADHVMEALATEVLPALRGR
jgi:5,10-methylenetetrahydromethanopterin reductase